MSFDRHQFRSLIERSLKRRQGLYSPAAVNLLLGTAAQESAFGTYLKQTVGPALGAFQIEPETFDWLKGKFLPRFPELINEFVPMLEWDIDLGIFIARLRYAVDPQPLPPHTDIRALGAYWKRVFNTVHGAGTVEQFMTNYARFVREV